MLQKITKTPSANVLLCEVAAVTRLKVCANLQVLRPQERQWKPRLRQAAGTLSDTRGQRSGTMK